MASKVVIEGSSVSASQLKEFFEQIAIGALCGKHMQAFIEHRNPFAEKAAAENTFLKCISAAKMITINSCDGSKTIANAEDMFAHIDSDFKNWGLNNPGSATAETVVDVYELIKDATCAQMFGSLGADLDRLCFTQHQIIEFCKQHADWPCVDGYATFFLFKVDGQFFVADVRVRSDGLHVGVYRFEDDRVWGAAYHHRVVTPQQTA